MAEHDIGSCSAGRALLDQLLDKWTLLILKTLWSGPLRFNAIKHRLNGVTQKTLTQCLRRMERNGMVTRKVIPVSPVAVEYEITTLGHSWCSLFVSMYAWTQVHHDEIEQARVAYDARQVQVEAA